VPDLSPELIDNLAESLYQHMTGATGATGHLNDFGPQEITPDSMKKMVRDLLNDPDTKFMSNPSSGERGGTLIFFNEAKNTVMVVNPNQLSGPLYDSAGKLISEKGTPDGFAGTFYREPKLNGDNIAVSGNSGRELKESEIKKAFSQEIKRLKRGIVDDMATQGHNITKDDIKVTGVKDPDADWARRLESQASDIKSGLERGKQSIEKGEWAEALEQRKIDTVLKSDELTSIAADKDGNVVHTIDEKTNSIVTIDKTTGQKTLQQFENADAAKEGFGKLIKEAANTTGEMPKLIQGGLEAVQDAIKASSSLFGKIAHLGGETAKFLGKAAKVLGPLGVIGATAEATAMEGHLEDALKFKMIPPEAATAYRAIIGSQLAQATVDPTMVGGEAVVQLAFEEWCNTYGVTGELKEQLEPGSLIEDLTGKEIGGKSESVKPLPEGVKQYSLMGDTGFEESEIVVQQDGPKGGSAPNTQGIGQPSVQRTVTTPYYEVAMMP